MEPAKLQAVFDEDLENLLKALGEYSKIENGDVFCSQCDVLITFHNIQLLIPRPNGRFEYICDRPDCVENYYRKSE